MGGSDWKPSQKENILSKTSKQSLENIVKELKMILDSDWSHYKYLIAVNTNEHIEVIFEDISS